MRRIQMFQRVAANGFFAAPDGDLDWASLLTRHGLIDDYTFVSSPIILGSGMLPIRDISAKLPLKLVDVKQFEHGNVRLRYAKA
ncbi:MAG: hypothetical protein ABJE66_07715 [Deltaproteobacteria bacterium]